MKDTYLCAYLLDYSACKMYKTACFDDEAFSREKVSYTNIPNDTHLLLLMHCCKTRLKIRHCILAMGVFSMSTGTGARRVWAYCRNRNW